MFLAIARIKSKGLFGRPLLPIKSTTDPDGIVLRWESESRIPKAGLWGPSFRKSYFIQTIVLCLRNFFMNTMGSLDLCEVTLVWVKRPNLKCFVWIYIVPPSCQANLLNVYLGNRRQEREATLRGGNLPLFRVPGWRTTRSFDPKFQIFYPTQLKSCLL